MPSAALDDLSAALVEVEHLLGADPSEPGEIPDNPTISRVVGRAAVVLLSSHFERYFYAVNEEAVEVINREAVTFAALPEILRLLHSRPAVEAIAGTTWDAQTRATSLSDFARTDAWLWGAQPPGAIDHSRLLEWMTAPTPPNIMRYYRNWSIPDIFNTVSETPAQRTNYWLRLTDLVGKRNAIAHGDVQAEATKNDIVEYSEAVAGFCDGADLALSDQLIDLFHLSSPW